MTDITMRTDMEKVVRIIDEILELEVELAEKVARIAELEDKLKVAEQTIKTQACVLEGIKLLYLRR